MELDSTRSEYYAYDPENNLNTYLIYLHLKSYFTCSMFCAVLCYSSLDVLVNQGHSFHHLQDQHLISGLQNIYFNRHLNGFGNQMKDSEFWESSACISIIKTQSHEIKISRF